jgi:1-deoxy-D-xylulose 5-phosphate reductoisomerase
LRGELSFVQIPAAIEEALESVPTAPVASVEEALHRDQEARRRTREWIARR